MTATSRRARANRRPSADSASGSATATRRAKQFRVDPRIVFDSVCRIESAASKRARPIPSTPNGPLNRADARRLRASPTGNSAASVSGAKRAVEHLRIDLAALGIDRDADAATGHIARRLRAPDIRAS